jgi:soluble lytic murein transglycosylase-like protein
MEPMRRHLAASLLLASFVLVSQTAPATFTPAISDIIELDPSAATTEEQGRFPSIAGVPSPESIQEAAPDASIPLQPPTKVSPLDRAKLALSRSEARAPSNNEICATLVAVARQHNLPLGFFTNLIWQESRFNHEAVSPAGAMGIAQFMPDVADALSLDAFEPRDALPASGKLLSDLRTRFGSLGLVAAAYNAGPKRVSDWLAGRRLLPSETHEYVNIITGYRAEQWRDKARVTVYQVPRQVPCHRSHAFVAVERAERTIQLEALAQERRAFAAAQAAARKREASSRRGKLATRSARPARIVFKRVAQAS